MNFFGYDPPKLCFCVATLQSVDWIVCVQLILQVLVCSVLSWYILGKGWEFNLSFIIRPPTLMLLRMFQLNRGKIKNDAAKQGFLSALLGGGA